MQRRILDGSWKNAEKIGWVPESGGKLTLSGLLTR
jgi:hypothetical protein